MLAKITLFLRRTQKATAALVGALSVFASATFIDGPVAAYVSLACVVGTWLLTYVFPYVLETLETVEEWPGITDDFDWSQINVPVTSEPVSSEPVRSEPVSGELLGPERTDTVELHALSETTVGIPVIEGEDSGVRPYPGPTVEDILNRIAAERRIIV
jgi:hypothetical protein